MIRIADPAARRNSTTHRMFRHFETVHRHEPGFSRLVSVSLCDIFQ